MPRQRPSIVFQFLSFVHGSQQQEIAPPPRTASQELAFRRHGRVRGPCLRPQQQQRSAFDSPTRDQSERPSRRLTPHSQAAAAIPPPSEDLTGRAIEPASASPTVDRDRELYRVP